MSEASHNPHASRLLILDADARAASALAAIAREAGFEPAHVADFNVLGEQDVGASTVVVLDLQLDGVDGIEVLRRLGASGSRAAVVIQGALDRRVLDAAHRLAIAHGLQVLGSFAKPVDGTVLRTLLRDFKPLGGSLPEAPVGAVSTAELQRALEQGEMQVYFQPKIAVATLEFRGVEALVRWAHPQRGIVAPDTFIRLAERSGLIVQLTRNVMARVFADCAAWQKAGLVVRAAINVSPRSLRELELPDLIEKLAVEHGLPPPRIIIEITEGWREEDEIGALDVLTRLRLKGFELSIDDFGTGYSSMLQLKRIPFNELKLAGSLIHGVGSDRDARVILESSVSLGHQLGLRVVAEGVERQEDWDLVNELGCDEAQGYFLARAMHADALPQWLERWQRTLGHRGV